MEAKNAYCVEMPIGNRESGVLIAIDKVKGEVSVATQAPVKKVPRVNIEEIYVRNVMYKNKAAAPKESPSMLKEFPLQAKIQMMKKTAELRLQDHKRAPDRFRLKPRQEPGRTRLQHTEAALNNRLPKFTAKTHSLQASGAANSSEYWKLDGKYVPVESQTDLLFGEAESVGQELSRSVSAVDDLPMNEPGLARIEEQSEEGLKSKSRVEPHSGNTSPLFKYGNSKGIKD